MKLIRQVVSIEDPHVTQSLQVFDTYNEVTIEEQCAQLRTAAAIQIDLKVVQAIFQAAEQYRDFEEVKWEDLGDLDLGDSLVMCGMLTANELPAAKAVFKTNNIRLDNKLVVLNVKDLDDVVLWAFGERTEGEKPEGCTTEVELRIKFNLASTVGKVYTLTGNSPYSNPELL